MTNKPVDAYYARQGQWIVDALYDKGFLDQELARESFRTLETFFGAMVQDWCDSAVRWDRLSRSLKEKPAHHATPQAGEQEPS